MSELESSESEEKIRAKSRKNSSDHQWIETSSRRHHPSMKLREFFEG